MLDIKKIRNNPVEINELLKRRDETLSIDRVLALDERRRMLVTKAEEMKAKQNIVSKEIPLLKKEKRDTTDVLNEMKELSLKIKEMDDQIRETDKEIRFELLIIPNIPNLNTVIGKDEEDNVEIRKFGHPRVFDFEIKAHWDLGGELEILDFERAAKISGARFSLFKGIGAKLERAIISFMLDVHTEEHGFTEIMPPYLVNRDSMLGTGQLPKFEDDMFSVPQKDMFLIPTAEVPVTNYYRDEILEEKDLPVYLTAYTPCFRAEAGSAGRDTRGLIRNHQFDKVEMVMFAHPDESYQELERLTNFAEEILIRLEIPYRVIELCTGDIGFSSAKTYDLEVWMPSYGRYVEISSCSNFEDYQARRANIKYRKEEDKKLYYLHTLNGSGLAAGRTFAAILENYQNEDGSVTIPVALRSYMGGLEKIVF